MKKIYQTQNKYLWQSLGFSWKDTPVISFVGGGGKSRLIRILSEELSEKKIGHRIFTTTHMWPMAGDAWGKQIGPVDASGKVCPPSEAEMQKIFGERLPVLIEADGSKGRPCKAPEAWEPVLRPETDPCFRGDRRFLSGKNDPGRLSPSETGGGNPRRRGRTGDGGPQNRD